MELYVLFEAKNTLSVVVLLLGFALTSPNKILTRKAPAHLFTAQVVWEPSGGREGLGPWAACPVGCRRGRRAPFSLGSGHGGV